MGSVRHAASLQAGVQGCNGGVGQRAQVPGRRVAGWQAVGHTTWAALRASPAGPSTAQTARPWRGRASARPDKQPSRFTTEACKSIYLVNTSHSTTQRNQSRLELRLSALSITRPADAHPCSRRPRWRLLQGHEPNIHWFSSNYVVDLQFFVAEPAGSAAAINYSRLQFRFGNWNSDNHCIKWTHTLKILVPGHIEYM